MTKRLLILVIIITSLSADLYSIETNSPDTTNRFNHFLQRNKKNLVISGLTLQQAASFYMEYQWWWKHDYHPFVMRSDGGFNNYSLGLDKVGHFYTSYMYSHALYELLKWGGVSERNCMIYSGALPFIWALSIEIGDGFSTYEFSPEDLLANSLGIGLAMAQQKVKALNAFKVKFSYYPGQYYIDNNFKGWSLTSDYNGHIYWLSAELNKILPKLSKGNPARYLNFAVGYGINNFPLVAYTQTPPIQRQFFIGLDYNLSAIPVKNNALKTFFSIADYYHLPAPGFKKTGTESWKFIPLLLN